MRTIPLTVAFVAALCFPALSADREVRPTEADYVIDAENRVGPVTTFSTEDDLIKAFGADNVQRAQLNLGDGPSDGTILFARSPKCAYVVWRGDHESPRLVKISEPGTPWATMEGVTVGTTLEDLERLNGRPFVIASVDLNKGARTLSWEGGTFAQELELELEPHDALDGGEIASVGRRMTQYSSDPMVRKLRYTVRTITVRW